MNLRLTDSDDSTFEYQPSRAPRSRTPRPYLGVPRLQDNGTYLCDSDEYTLVAYTVRLDENGLRCSCPFYAYNYACKHCDAVAQMRADEKPRAAVTLESLFEQPAPVRRERVKEEW